MEKWLPCVSRLVFRISAVLVFLSAFLFVACSSPDPGWRESVLEPLAHLPGTLLRDSHGRYWVVGRWPDRELVIPREIGPSRLDATRAIPMSDVEETCLRRGGMFTSPRMNWNLYRVPDGRYFYVDLGMRYKHEAALPVIRAWSDDPDAAFPWENSMQMFEHLRDLDPMGLPQGTLIRTPEHLYYFFDGEAHAFASEDLARQAGYDPGAAIELSERDLPAYADAGEPLTPHSFLVCPMAAANAVRDDDQDGDGYRTANDCDDHNANRAPGLMELCDGIDNNCDGIVDDGYDLGHDCIADPACNLPGVTRCTYDGLGTECRNDENACDDGS